MIDKQEILDSIKPYFCSSSVISITKRAIDTTAERYESRIEELEQALLDIKTGKDNPEFIVDSIINK